MDIVESKVQMFNDWQSPIKDEYIEKYLTEHQKRGLNLKAITDGESAYVAADYVIIATPANYDPKKNFVDTSVIETVINLVLQSSDTVIMVVRSTIPVGYTERIFEKFEMKRIIFSLEFLRESKDRHDKEKYVFLAYIVSQ